MRGKSYLSIYIILFCLVISLLNSASANANDDHGNDYTKATPVTIGTIISGELEYGFDEDFFSFEAEEGTVYHIEVIPGTLSAWSNLLYDTDGDTLIASARSILVGGTTLKWKCITSGTYYLDFFGLRFCDVGTYSFQITIITDDHGDDYTTATHVDVDTLLDSAIEYQNDVDYFSFDAVEGETYVIDSILPIYCLDPASGSATVLLSSAGSGLDLGLEPGLDPDLDPGLDFQHTYLDITALAIGTQYTLNNSDLYLYDTDGTSELAYNSLGNYNVNVSLVYNRAGKIIFTCKTSGTYFVRVSGENPYNVGTYGFIVNKVTDDHGTDATTATHVTVGTTVDGEINYRSDFDYFSFEANAGESYKFEIIKDTLDVPVLFLFDTDGISEIGYMLEGAHVSGSSLYWTCPVSGTYYMKARSRFLTGLGTYTLTISTITQTDDYGNHAAYATEITTGDTFGGVIDYNGDTDFFFFEAKAGGNYNLLLTQNAKTIIGMGLLDNNDAFGLEPYRRYLYYTYSKTGMKWHCLTGGTYYIMLGTSCYNEGDTYSLTLLEFYDDHGNTQSDATPMAVGTTVDGKLDINDDDDFFSFYAVSGTKYVVETTLGTLKDSSLFLYNSETAYGHGAHYNDNGDGDSKASRLYWTCWLSGTCYVKVKSPFRYNLRGTYSLTIDEYNDDHGDIYSTATYIDTRFLVNGNIDHYYDYDFFSFYADEGETYTIKSEAGTVDNTVIYLMRPYYWDVYLAVSEQIDCYNDISTLTWTCPSSGLYYLRINPNYDSLSTGTYTLSVSLSDGPPPVPNPCDVDDYGDDYTVATQVFVDLPAYGVINCDTDLDYFSFEGVSGTSYHILTDLITLQDATVTLFDTDGTTSIDLGINRKFECQVSGTYYVEVKGIQAGYLGSYELLIKYTCCDDGVGSGTGGDGDTQGETNADAASQGGGGSGCFIATASYDDKNEVSAINRLIVKIIKLLK